MNQETLSDQATAPQEPPQALGEPLAPLPPLPPLQALRAPFPAEAVGLLPKGRKVPENQWVRCDECGANMGPHVHLSFIGHAAVTDRLLTVDDHWNWEPYTEDESGLPCYRDSPNGTQVELWIRLTVAGVTRIGIGVVDKSDEDLGKRLVSDALKNAAMRFGVALELWSKDELESLIGSEKTTTSRRRAPRSSTSTGSSSRPPRARTDPATDGIEGMAARDRNKLISHLAHMTPPLTDPKEMLPVLTGILERSEPLPAVVKLTAEEGRKLFEHYGIES